MDRAESTAANPVRMRLDRDSLHTSAGEKSSEFRTHDVFSDMKAYIQRIIRLFGRYIITYFISPVGFDCELATREVHVVIAYWRFTLGYFICSPLLIAKK